MKNKKGKSPVWEYFGFNRTHDETLNQKNVICKVCHTELSYSGNTTNMWAHVECKHPIKHKPISSQAAKDKTESSSNQPTIEVVVEQLKSFSKDSEQHVKLVEAVLVVSLL